MAPGAVGAATGVLGFALLAVAHSQTWQVIVGSVVVNAYISLAYGALPALVIREVDAGDIRVGDVDERHRPNRRRLALGCHGRGPAQPARPRNDFPAGEQRYTLIFVFSARCPHWSPCC